MASDSISDSQSDYDTLTGKLTQLHAMLTMTYGAGAENFSELSERTRDNYLWACASMVRECETLTQRLSPLIYRSPLSASGELHG